MNYLIPVIGFLFGLAGALRLYLDNQSGLPDWAQIGEIWAARIVWLIVSLLVVGGVLTILWLAVFILNWLSRKRRQLFGLLDKVLSGGGLLIANCVPADITRIDEIARMEFGDAATPLERTRWLFDIDPESFKKVIDGKGRILGYYCLFRLSRMGMAAIERGEFDILTAPREYFRADNKRRRNNIYVGSVFGNGWRTRAAALGALGQAVVSLRPKSIFAKAATPDGLRILHDYRFRPVSANCRTVGCLFQKKYGHLLPLHGL